MNILVIGGAGFIGSHTVDALCRRGHRVSIYDNLSLPVHMSGKPGYLPDIPFIEADVRNKDELRKALRGIDVVFNFAAYQDYLPDFSTYYSVNAAGTALIYETIVEERMPVRKVIVASSQAVAGEGVYLDEDGNFFSPGIRSESQLRQGQWEIKDHLGRPAFHQKTPETLSNPQNQYGISKLCQEMIAINTGKRYGIPSVAMRYSIVQGARQSFYNAYSGACRVFCLNLHFNRALVIYEDGMQIRDYVNINDVVAANLLVMDDERADYRVFNVGGGRGYTVLQLAAMAIRIFNKEIEPSVPGLYRFGDTRHIFSDISALESLGWHPAIGPEESLREYKDYLEQADVKDVMEQFESKMRSLNIVRAVDV